MAGLNAACVGAPAAEEIAAKVTQRLNEMQTIQADVVAEYWETPGRDPMKVMVRVTGDRPNKLTRMEITQHPVLEGQIVIVDLKKDIATVYMPVTGQAFRGKSSVIASQLGVDLTSLDPDRLLALDPTAALTIKLLRQERVERIPHYVMETRVPDRPEGFQLVWVDCETYLVKKVEVFDAQSRKLANVVIGNLNYNFKLDPNKLRELPKGTRVTDLK
jgi:outer membrane lipoprotein-sorting protein